MLPGKKYAPEDYILEIVWKRKWLIAVPVLVIGAPTFLYSGLFRIATGAQTSVLVIPQRVPRSFVTVDRHNGYHGTAADDQPADSEPHSPRRIAQEFNLYAARAPDDDHGGCHPADAGRHRHRHTTPRRGREGASSFTISYESASARTAMMVTERLALLFVQENLQDRELLANATNQFLEAELEDAKRRLIEHEKRLEQFRRDNAGRLPDQVQSNLQMMQNAQLQSQALAESSNRIEIGSRFSRVRSPRSSEPPLASAAASANLSPTDTSSAIPQPGTAAQQLEAGDGEPARARAAPEAAASRHRPGETYDCRARSQGRGRSEGRGRGASAAPTAAAVRPADPAAAARAAQMRAEIETIQRRLDARRQTTCA